MAILRLILLKLEASQIMTARPSCLIKTVRHHVINCPVKCLYISKSQTRLRFFPSATQPVSAFTVEEAGLRWSLAGLGGTMSSQGLMPLLGLSLAGGTVLATGLCCPKDKSPAAVPSFMWPNRMEARQMR